jgi:hypothetical protein
MIVRFIEMRGQELAYRLLAANIIVQFNIANVILQVIHYKQSTIAFDFPLDF